MLRRHRRDPRTATLFPFPARFRYRGHYDHGLGGFHRHQIVVEADGVAFLDVPLDDGGVGQAFAEVGEQEFLVGHDVSWGSPGIVIPTEVRELVVPGRRERALTAPGVTKTDPARPTRSRAKPRHQSGPRSEEAL